MGLWSRFPPTVITYAAEDILVGTLWSTTVVLLVFSIPDIIANVTSPYIINRISFRSTYALLTLILVGSYALLVVIDDVRIRMVAVGFIGMYLGCGIVTGMRMLSYYDDAEVYANAFENGSTISTIAVSLVYTG